MQSTAERAVVGGFIDTRIVGCLDVDARCSVSSRTPVALLLLLLSCVACTEDRRSPEGRRGTSSAVSMYVLDSRPLVTHPLDVVFDNRVKLLGYDIDQEGALPRGQPIRLTLYWTLTERLDGRWKLATQVLDSTGRTLADLYDAGPLRAGRRGHPRLPPSAWSPGKFYVDKLELTLPARTAARRVSVVAGVYRDSSLVMQVTEGKTYAPSRALVASFDVAIDNPGITLSRLAPSAAIHVDGRLDEPAWNDSVPLGPFVRVAVRPSPFDASSPGDSSVTGDARMLWNGGGLYIGWEVHDEDVRAAPSAETASDLGEDGVVVVVDPDGDGEPDYELQIDPRNVQFATRSSSVPSVNERTERRRTRWRSGALSAVAVRGTLDRPDDRDEGYVVEAMIPWAGFPNHGQRAPAPGDSWKMNLYAVAKTTGVGWAASFAKDDYRSSPSLGTVVFAATDGSLPGLAQ